ncbi:ribosomal RNA methyltransferase FtsJ domain-containing protein [Sordaria sp. MPI-SDFR-AT-0083]|nr:ribosomal RNA methyltransferase FtsJ domain-containing protein [Sordaria sp. MPI-SDFR-AT-0083]
MPNMLPRRLPPGLLRLRSTSTSLTSTILSPTINTTTITTRASQFLTTNPTTLQTRPSSSSTSRWKTRQFSDRYAREARTAGLKSRAAFKLLEINKKYRLFRPSSGQIVVDLGFAPGSWSQVALDLTKPDGKVVGIDIIPAQPPRGVSAIQGNFLSEGVRGLVKGWLREEEGRKVGEQLREMARREQQRLEEKERLERERLEAEEREAREREAEERRVREEEEERREWGLDQTETETEEVVNQGEGKLNQKNDYDEEMVEEMDRMEITDRWQEELLYRQRHEEPNTWEVEALRRQRERQEQRDAEKQVVVDDRPSYIELERMAVLEAQVMQQHQSEEVMEQKQEREQGQEDSGNKAATTTDADADAERKSDSEEGFEELEEHEEQQPQRPKKKKQNEQMRLVDVVLSDMSEPWPQTSSFSIKTLSNPYNRMMNTSGISFKDHAGSMDLCYAALSFANDTLKPGGHFVCKFYQGSEDKKLEDMLRKLFGKVFRDKPDSSRSESKEAYFVALNRRRDVILEDIPI